MRARRLEVDSNAPDSFSTPRLQSGESCPLRGQRQSSFRLRARGFNHPRRGHSDPRFGHVHQRCQADESHNSFRFSRLETWRGNSPSFGEDSGDRSRGRVTSEEKGERQARYLFLSTKSISWMRCRFREQRVVLGNNVSIWGTAHHALSPGGKMASRFHPMEALRCA